MIDLKQPQHDPRQDELPRALRPDSSLRLSPSYEKTRRNGVMRFRYAILAAIGLVIAYLAYSVLMPTRYSSDGQIPLVAADTVPSKIKPEQPGGIEIPNQDKLVYERLEGKPVEKSGDVEKLAPAPEEPVLQEAPTDAADTGVGYTVEKPVVSAPSATDSTPPASVAVPAPPQPVPAVAETKIQDMSEQQAEAPVPLVPLVPKAEQPTPTIPLVPDHKTTTMVEAIPAPKAVEAPKTVETPKVLDLPPANAPKPKLEKLTEKPVVADKPKILALPENKPAPAKMAAPKSVASGAVAGFKVQLASFPDEATAKKNAAQLQQRFASALSGASLSVVRADLGAKGIYYRIQAPMSGEAAARSTCANIQSAGGSCILVRP
jgi:hypothetical protein